MKGIASSEIQHGLNKTLLAFTGREHLFMTVMGGIAGAVGGYGAVLFWKLIAAVAQFGWGNVTGMHGKDLLSMTLAAPLWIKILIPAIGGLLIAIIVYFFAHEAKGHGLPEVMEAPKWIRKPLFILGTERFSSQSLL